MATRSSSRLPATSLPAAAAELPTAEAEFNKYIEATSGTSSYENLTSVSTRGSVEIVGQGIKGTITSVNVGPASSTW